MSSNVDVLTTAHIRPAVASDLPALTALWSDMYVYQQSCGMLGEIPEDAAALWSRTVERALGSRLCVILVAERNETTVGFIEGVVTAGPAYLGGEAVGVIRHLFVQAADRKAGLGRQLVEVALEAFRAAGAQAVELQVVRGNQAGEAFWQALGWQTQLVQMRRTI